MTSQIKQNYLSVGFLIIYLLYTHNIYLILSIFWVIQEIPNQFKSIFFYFFCVYSPKIAKNHIERSLMYRYICTNPHNVKNQLFFFACLGVRTENLALLFSLLANWANTAVNFTKCFCDTYIPQVTQTSKCNISLNIEN